MPTKTVKDKELKGKEIELVDDENEDELTPEESDVLTALAEMDGASDARWQVTRVAPSNDPVNKPLGFCDELTSAELSLKELQRRFGRGKYRIRGFRSSGGYLAHKTVTIATDPPKVDMSEKSELNAKGASAMEVFLAQQEKSAERRWELLLALAPALPAIIQSFRGGNSTNEAVTLLAGLKQLQPEQKQLDLMPIVTVLLENMRDSGDSKGATVIDLIQNTLNTVAPAIASKLAAPANPQPVQVMSRPVSPQATQPQVVAQPQVVQQEEVNPMFKLLQWARSTLAMLVKKAERDADPILCAEWVLDDVPDDVDLNQFLAHLNADDWFMRLQQFEPKVAPYESWFAQFRAGVIDTLEEINQAGTGTDSDPNADTLQ